MAEEERQVVLNALRDNRLDCVVQVQMLGEGFDHPRLSVAAIFRPFRSLSAYIQFIGRIMRVNYETEPQHPDNEGFIISHVGLNNDARWKDFREIELADQQMFHQLLVAMNTGPELPTGTGEGSGAGTSRRFDTGMTVVDEIVSHFITHSFLDPKDDRVLETILNQPIPGTPLKMRDLTDRKRSAKSFCTPRNSLPGRSRKNSSLSRRMSASPSRNGWRNAPGPWPTVC